MLLTKNQLCQYELCRNEVESLTNMVYKFNTHTIYITKGFFIYFYNDNIIEIQRFFGEIEEITPIQLLEFLKNVNTPKGQTR